MADQKDVFWETLTVLKELNILDNVIVIGSWAEYIYENYFDGFKSNIKTMDIDLFYTNLRKPDKKVDLIKTLEDRDFVAMQDRYGVTRFYKEGKIEVEFLVREMGRGQIEPYEIKPLGIKVTGLL